MNRRAFDLALRAALALNCRIAPFTKWDRKNYWYPDLPKNYQISQYDLPFSSAGHLEIETAGGVKRVGIIRVHLEEDAGKSLHDESGGGGVTKVDLNRTGTPLLEIVSHPEMNTPEEAKAYLEELRLLLRELGVSDCEMQEGSLRCDANVNVHVPLPDGPVAATPLTEIKNLNSFRAVERSIAYEARRQYEQFLKDGKVMGQVAKSTAGWDDARGVTKFQRGKEEASDYRYFPDPDLVPVVVTAEEVEQVLAALGELPAEQRARLVKQYGLSDYDAEVLSRGGRALVAFFEAVVAAGGDPKEASNWVTNQVLATLNERKQELSEFPLTPAQLGGLIKERQATGLNVARAREVYARMLETGESAADAIQALGFTVVSDEGALRELVRRAIAANPKAVADYKRGKLKAADAIKGFVMRETKGMAKTEAVQRLLQEELATV
jgi:aspartyl-tRNA(Asn)/glutamyl-tRNA(Gln) amidotransferase subunit B